MRTIQSVYNNIIIQLHARLVILNYPFAEYYCVNNLSTAARPDVSPPFIYVYTISITIVCASKTRRILYYKSFGRVSRVRP